MVTAKEVFDITMDLIDEREETGIINPTNTKGYQVKTPGILTILQAELLQKEDVSKIPVKVETINDTLQVSDRTALIIMPYGLAAHLMLTEDPDSASFFQQRYEELKRNIPAVSKKITDVYGVLSGMAGDL